MKKKTTKPKADPTGPIWEWPNGHYCGPGIGGNGFEVRDGAIYLSPGHQSHFTKIKEERDGVNSLLEATNTFAEKRFREIQKQTSAWFDYVLENIGATPVDKEWVYLHDEGCLKRRPKDDAKP